MTSNAPSPGKSTSTVWTYLKIIFRPLTKLWNAILMGLLAISLLGGFLIIGMMPSLDKKKPENDTTTDVNTDGADTAQIRPSERKYSFYPQTLQKLGRPTTPWVPLASTTFAILYAFRFLQDHHVQLSGTTDFVHACPEDGRRTQTSAFVKLFAASATTICIHGHLGSLAGSGSWKRELFRAVEVLASPLAFLFATAASVWYEIAFLPVFRKCPWSENIGLKYRLARMCSVCIHAESPSSSFSNPNPYLGVINPVHIEAVPLKRDLKWAGRVLILVILFAQYVQAGLLLTRRLLSDTAASIDLAMFFMVLSGLTALVTSLIISLINISWRFSTSSTNSEPCVAKGCRLPECQAFKIEQSLPNDKFSFVVFGYEIAAALRVVLHGLAGGNLQITIMQDKYRREAWWQVVLMLFGQYNAWELGIYVAAYANIAWEFICEELNSVKRTSTSDTGSPDESSEVVPPPPIPAPSTAKEASTRQSSMFMDLSFLPFIFMFVFGLLGLAFALCAIVYHLFFLIGPCVNMYVWIAPETSTWMTRDVTKQCPQLWKDGLEDELWWF